MAEPSKRGRPPIDKEHRERERRRAVLQKGLLACYEVIDTCRKELADLDAADAKGNSDAANRS